jgi:hypothetical protein
LRDRVVRREAEPNDERRGPRSASERMLPDESAVRFHAALAMNYVAPTQTVSVTAETRICRKRSIERRSSA